ncbi:type VII secretion system-associated protein [Streptomyces pakalii]|uniref:Type VII secretion system-associated protein n=1 Tax=Streptomyces pakalii TaxID=3036494 RepID=A0ABT7DD69_9ACTN|nr:type VII secretion system-associated protein [Streptomyces pakalii]MDJ1642902.1 type VII secretion system-associated protein [Streptomyces pakalii]
MPASDAYPADTSGPATSGGTAGSRARTPAAGAVAVGEPGFPAPPADMVAAARIAPDHWLSVTDRHWLAESDEEPAPPWAVLGRWRSDAYGEIVAWEPNPDYRPSPAARGWAPPVSDADAAVQLAAAGYGPEGDVALALAEAAAVAVCVAEDGEPAWTRLPGGAHALPVFPEPPQAPPDRLPPHVMMTLPELLDRLPPGGEIMFLSASAPAALLIRADELRARWEETASSPAPTDGTPATESGTPSEGGHHD